MYTYCIYATKATGNSRSGIPGNSRESGYLQIPGGNSREFYAINLFVLILACFGLYLILLQTV